ncbi:DHH family phosphoesterase [Candidatus Bathyarchaeota archaeon]|nr:DHH family phosphoesterase [Candidatus Bathyarchaeota archaeon]MBS7628116.1 DHH family phosphoesterase [Candidatus Bathyarchaeota archaeon]
MTGESKRLNEFFQRISEAAVFLSRNALAKNPVRIVSHLDADGLAAASIVARALARLGVGFHVRILQQLDEESIPEAFSGKPGFIVFTDLGSGNLDLVHSALQENGGTCLILDHHQPLELAIQERENLLEVNPCHFGLDGGEELSASGLAYLVAKAMDDVNISLAYLGLIGALGDLQDRSEDRGFKGLNLRILDDALQKGQVEVNHDLLLFGRETRPLHKALATTMSPLFPGLSGEEDQCLGFFNSLGIPVKDGDRLRVPADLDQEEKKRLYSGLVEYLVTRGLQASEAKRLIGKVYIILKEGRFTPLRDAREFASLLNACGRVGKAGLALALGLGDRREKVLQEADETLALYRRKLTQQLEALEKSQGTIVELQNLYVVRSEEIVDERMLSPILGLLHFLGRFPKPKPVLAMSYSGEGKERLKVSIRAADALVNAGLNLGIIMEGSAREVGGRGGGHAIAAGATIPSEKRDAFLATIDRRIGLQIGGKLLG